MNKAAQYDAIAARAARETEQLNADIAELQRCARDLAQAVVTTAESMCVGEPARASEQTRIAQVESYARETAIALRDLCEKRTRLADIQRLMGAT